MIEVNALLQRGTVFLAGETLQCNITFKNVGLQTAFHGLVPRFTASAPCESRVFLPKALHLSTEDMSTSADTSFVPSKGEHGMTVLSTKPRILFCDLKLEQGQSKTFTYTEVVPVDSPPSFRGQAVKYSYKLTIGTQRLNHPTKLLRIPFRILVLHGLNDLSVYLEPAEVQPANPFLLQKTEDTVLDIALHILETVTCRKGPHSYNITNSRGRVARCVMFKTAYKLGEDIIGIMDFSETNVSCVQFSVTLQSEETISEECRKKSAQGSSVTSYVRHQDTCLNTLKSHFSVPVPLTATPGFITDIVCQRWRLHFEFITTVEPIQGEVHVADDDSSTWRGPATLQTETMVWDFPVKIYPSHPGHASSVTLLKLLHSITV